MRTYQKQYGGRFVRRLVYHRVEESWYWELGQICHSARGESLCLCLFASEKQALKTTLRAFGSVLNRVMKLRVLFQTGYGF